MEEAGKDESSRHHFLWSRENEEERKTPVTPSDFVTCEPRSRSLGFSGSEDKDLLCPGGAAPQGARRAQESLLNYVHVPTRFVRGTLAHIIFIVMIRPHYLYPWRPACNRPCPLPQSPFLLKPSVPSGPPVRTTKVVHEAHLKSPSTGY